MRLQKIKKIIESHRCHQNVVFMLELNLFLLEFYYLQLFIYIRELSWRQGVSLSIYSVINKRN